MVEMVQMLQAMAMAETEGMGSVVTLNLVMVEMEVTPNLVAAGMVEMEEMHCSE